MRVVLDTNVLISALLNPNAPPAELLTAWRSGQFELLTAVPQIDELARVTRYPKLRGRLNPALAGRLINELRDLGTEVTALPPVDVSPDQYDNYLLSIASGGRANYLVTGDKRDLLALRKHESTSIVSVRDFLAQCRR